MRRTVTIVFKIICFILIVGHFAQAQDSREGDSLALIAFMEANPSSFPWLTEEPINDWSGITAGPGPTDRVTGISEGNKVIGTLPPEIANLTQMTILTLNNNSIATLPPELGSCAALTELVFDDNFLTTLPAEIANLTNLATLSLLSNYINSLPPEIGDLSSLEQLFLDNNELTSLPTEMGNLSSLTIITLDHNWLHFDDIELMKGFVEECYYRPQDTLGSATTDTLSPQLKIGVAIRGSANHYAWTKDGDSTGGDTDSISVTEAGVYVCNITSDSITDLTLTHKPMTIVTETPVIVINNKTPQSEFLIVPNVGTQKTIIRYQLPVLNHVELTIYDVTGQKVSTLVSEQQQPGSYRYLWDAGGIANGAYFCQLTVGNFVQVKKFILRE